ncbi:hypothetical protein CEXT_472851 [Caerostris extrusa]|uniref:Uncharacterized protein n=1 Tax=Caerostris extrusa TaxID=172846 RepID=A0AAV4X9R6_CAEEX|nr:hypothetical protein CEXT_472851 [Caerostris extrusa]
MTFPVSDIGTLCPCHKGPPPSPKNGDVLQQCDPLMTMAQWQLPFQTPLTIGCFHRTRNRLCPARPLCSPKCCPPIPFMRSVGTNQNSRYQNSRPNIKRNNCDS